MGRGLVTWKERERLWSEASSTCEDIRKWPHQMVNEDQIPNLCMHVIH